MSGINDYIAEDIINYLKEKPSTPEQQMLQPFLTSVSTGANKWLLEANKVKKRLQGLVQQIDTLEQIYKARGNKKFDYLTTYGQFARLINLQNEQQKDMKQLFINGYQLVQLTRSFVTGQEILYDIAYEKSTKGVKNIYQHEFYFKDIENNFNIVLKDFKLNLDKIKNIDFQNFTLAITRIASSITAEEKKNDVQVNTPLFKILKDYLTDVGMALENDPRPAGRTLEVYNQLIDRHQQKILQGAPLKPENGKYNFKTGRLSKKMMLLNNRMIGDTTSFYKGGDEGLYQAKYLGANLTDSLQTIYNAVEKIKNIVDNDKDIGDKFHEMFIQDLRSHKNDIAYKTDIETAKEAEEYLAKLFSSLNSTELYYTKPK